MIANYDAIAIAGVMGLIFEEHAVEPGKSAQKKKKSNTATPTLIQRAVEHGLPRNALRQVARNIAGSDLAQVSALEWDIVPKTTLERRKESLTPGESERTERLARLFVHAQRALGTENEARDFMTIKHPELDGDTPIEATRTDLGTRRVEDILFALEYGLAL